MSLTVKPAKKVLVHNNGCGGVLKKGMCPRCEVFPSGHEVRAVFHCPKDDIELGEDHKCPKCNTVYSVDKTVHAVIDGVPLCGFANTIPCSWPLRHSWTEISDIESITCPKCKAMAEELMKKAAPKK